MTTPSASLSQRVTTTPSKTELVNTIYHTLRVLAEPGQLVELRIPNVNGKRTDSGYFTDMQRLAQAAASYDGRAEGIYITLNPVNPALLARCNNRIKEYARQTTSDADVLARRWFFVDLDPVRPAGISSSDAEHAAALERARDCQQWLQQRHVTCVLADSGNGAHVLIPVELPNDEASATLIKALLAVLDKQFSDTVVKVDTSTAAAAHLIKLYGTLACKGDSIPDRPHRRSAILAGSNTLPPVNATQLKALLAHEAPVPSPAQPKSTQRANLVDDLKTRFDMVAYAEHKLGVQAVKDGREYRLPGHNGFLVNPEKSCWYHHGGEEGGDALDLVGYLLYGTAWTHHDATMFKAALREAASFVGMDLEAIQAGQSPTKDSTATREAAAQPDLLDVAQVWQARFGQQYAWESAAARWREWTGTHWRVEPKTEQFRLVTANLLREQQVRVNTIHKVNGVLELVKPLVDRDFRPSAYLVNFRNGTLDLRIMTLGSHNPADELTEWIDYDYVADRECTHIQQFLADTIPDEGAQRAYMTHVGAALIGDLSLHKALVILGPTRSGKSTLLKLAQMTLGYRAGRFASSILFSSEGKGANSRAKWVDTTPRLVCLDEFPEEAIKDDGEEIFKSMTAHGGVSMWLKYRDERAENVWYPKLMFATNNRMRYRDQSGALTRRLIIVECPNSRPDHKQDGDLLNKLAPELGAFAVACIRLALEAQRTRHYPESAAMRALLNQIATNGDSVKLWFAEHCVYDPQAFTSSERLYSHFRIWCAENGLFPISRPKLHDALLGLGQGILHIKRRAWDERAEEKRPLWGFMGIRFRQPDDPDPDLDESEQLVLDVPVVDDDGSATIAHQQTICSSVPQKTRESLGVEDTAHLADDNTGASLPEFWNGGTDQHIDPKTGEILSQVQTDSHWGTMPNDNMMRSEDYQYHPDLADTTYRRASHRQRSRSSG